MHLHLSPRAVLSSVEAQQISSTRQVYLWVEEGGRTGPGRAEVSAAPPEALCCLRNAFRMFQPPKTKGVLSTALIPQERFWQKEGITTDFNHVTDHQELGYSARLLG